MLVLVVLVWFAFGCCLLLVLVTLFNGCGYLVVACCGCMLFWLSGVFVLFWCCLCLMLLRVLFLLGIVMFAQCCLERIVRCLDAWVFCLWFAVGVGGRRCTFTLLFPCGISCFLVWVRCVH